MTGIFFNQGEVCCAGSRLFIEDQIYDESLAKLKKRAEALVVGNPMDPKTQIGAQVSAEQFNWSPALSPRSKKSASAQAVIWRKNKNCWQGLSGISMLKNTLRLTHCYTRRTGR